MRQPIDCATGLVVSEMDDAPLSHDSQLPGYWMWGALFLAVLIFEAWAVLSHHRTLSETVQHGPRWFKWAMGLGLVALLFHLFKG
jgi:hypothetical protein